MPVPIIFFAMAQRARGRDFLQGHKRQPFRDVPCLLKRMLSYRTPTLRAVFRRLRGTKDVAKHYQLHTRRDR